MVVGVSGSGGKVLVWDGATRLFHWVVVMLFAAAYVTWRLNRMDWHAYAGYALFTAVLFRIRSSRSSSRGRSRCCRQARA